ncbi:hypothetical protein D3C78_921210 [compost metagenome]
MGTHGQGDGQYRDPQPAGVGGEDHADDGAGEDQHGYQASGDGLDATADQPGAEDAATDAAEVGGQPDQDQRDAHLGHADAQAVLLVEEGRQPVEVEPEHRRGDRVGQGEGPGAAHAQDAGEGHLDRLRLDGLVDVVQLALLHLRMFFGVEVVDRPEHQPDDTQAAHADEGRLPAPDTEDQRQQGRGDHGADVGAGIEDAGGQGAFAGREPEAGGLHAGRVVGRFGQAEDEAADHEAGGRGGQPVGAGGEAPEQHREEEGALDADLVDEAALEEEADGVADLEPEVDVGVVHGGPAHLLGQDRLHHAQRGTVDVVQGGGEEHQGQHAPARLADGEGGTDLLADTGVGVHRGERLRRYDWASRGVGHERLPVS